MQKSLGSVYDVFRGVAQEVRNGKRKGMSRYKKKLQERRNIRLVQRKVSK